MKQRKNHKIAKERHIDTLVIIGNGFDIWQGLDTRYSNFYEYYLKHRKSILKKLHLKEHMVFNDLGEKLFFSDVELIYGNPFIPGELSKSFWNTFEDSLGEIDAENLNMYFGKDKSGLRKMNRCIKNAKRILQESFCGWVMSIESKNENSTYKFGENCIFINFNYTDTLVTAFGVDPADDYHIHGTATDKKSIIFGHSSHPEMPEPLLYKLGGRFRGLFFVDNVLYETDKHVQDNIQYLIAYLSLKGVMCDEINNIYVLGHSFGRADAEYFEFLNRATKIGDDSKNIKSDDYEDFSETYLDNVQNRLEYKVNRYGYGKKSNSQMNIDVKSGFEYEQSERNKIFQKEFYKLIKKHLPTNEGEYVKTLPRVEDASWHVSWFSKEDKMNIEKALNDIGCKKYHLYPSIDECLNNMNKI